MQNLANTERIIRYVWGYINYNKDASSLKDIYASVLYILYGIHKNYPAEELYNDVYFTPYDNSDLLLNDLYRSFRGRKSYNDLLRLYVDLKSIPHDTFEECYIRVLSELNHRLSLSTGRLGDDFLTPEALNSLISYYVRNEGCEIVYDPFCGTASILHQLSDNYEDLIYFGQDVSVFSTLIARVNYEACFGYDSHISCKDSVREWDFHYFDAVVSCPPLGVKLSEAEKDFLYDEFHYKVKSLEELFFLRSLKRNDPHLMICLTSHGFSFRDGEKEIRKELVERNLLDTIVSLPANLLYGTSVPCLLFVCKKDRGENDFIKIVHAEDFILGKTKQERTFDIERFISVIESNSSDYCVNVKTEELRNFDYILNPALYINKNFNLTEGQKVFLLKDLIVLEEGLKEETVVGAKTLLPAKMKTNFIQILLCKNKTDLITGAQKGSRFKVYETQGRKTLLLVSEMGSVMRYALYDDKAPLYCNLQMKVYSINEEYVNPEYILYVLLNNPSINSSRMSIKSFADFPIVIDAKEKQNDLIARIKRQHSDRLRAEQEADALRLGVKRNISDLEHMLGTPQSHVDNIIYELERMTPNDDNYLSAVKNLKDNVEYIKRIISYSNAQISDDMFNAKDFDIEEYIINYKNSWMNYSGNYFDLTVNTCLEGRKIVRFDKTLLKVALDAILTNAERHGFNKRKKDTNQAEISLTLESYEHNSYVVIRVANNGDPFRDGFTLEDYITRGRYSTSTGRSGLGGYHVYKIAKGHHGYIFIDSNKIWNVIVEILLPIDNVEPNDLIEYEHECI